ncbi:hypothetical protein Tco_0491474 [Tanacetum coccineum]
MKEVFDQMEAEVDQNVVDKKRDEIERKNLLIENENLIGECLSKDVFYTATKYVLTVSRFSNMHDAFTAAHKRIAELEAENSNLTHKIQNDDHDEIIKHFSKLEMEHLNLQLKYQHLKERFGKKKSLTSSDAPPFKSFFYFRLQPAFQSEESMSPKPQLFLTSEVAEKQAGNVQTSLTLSSAKLEIQSMVDVPIHHEDAAIQRTLLIDTIISMVTDKIASTPTPPTTQVQVSKWVRLLLVKRKFMRSSKGFVSGRVNKKGDIDTDSIPEKLNDFIIPILSSISSYWVHIKMELASSCSGRDKFITACSYLTNTLKEIMKAQAYVSKLPQL